MGAVQRSAGFTGGFCQPREGVLVEGKGVGDRSGDRAD